MHKNEQLSRIAKIIKTVFILCIGIFAFGCKPIWMQVRKYSGDGEIRTCSSLFRGGYAIKFEDFATGSPYARSYRLSHVPHSSRGANIGRPELNLRFKWAGTPNDWTELRKALTGIVSFTLSDGTGHVVKTERLSLGKMGWTESQTVWGLANPEKSSFYFEAGKSYILQVRYIPGEIQIPAASLYFELDDCAFY